MKCKVVLDSGAFSAWRLGKLVDLEQYCDYLLDNPSWIDHYVALDVIMPDNPEEAARLSFENYRYMRKRGLKPMPVFHAGEGIDWLHRMLDAGADYIGLASLSLPARSQADAWYADCWSHLVDRSGLPIIKAHAFGEGRRKSVERFPWQSADSTSWTYTAQRTGRMKLPGGGMVSMRNDGAGSKSSPDAASLSEEDREVFEAVLREARIDPLAFENDAKESWVMRAYMTALYYADIQQRVRTLHPIRHRSTGFFAPAPQKAPVVELDPFNMVLVCSEANVSAFPIIAQMQHPNILVSYFYLSKERKDKNKPRAEFARGFDREQLIAFAADPVGFVSTTEPWLSCWNIIQKYVK